MRSDQWAGREADLPSRQAEDWFLAERSRMDEAEAREFRAWLAVPEHADQFSAVEQLVQELREAVDPDLDSEALIRSARADAAEDLEQLTPLRDAGQTGRRVPRVRQWQYAVAATLAAAALALLWLIPKHAPPLAEQITVARYATAHGERATRPLPDGSVLKLDADSSVTLRYSGSERRLDLERGQVVFEVVHDAARPFHVLAGAADIVDVGTTFTVSLHGESTVVTVVDGRVRVGLSSGPAAVASQQGKILSAASSPPASSTMELSAGDQVRVVAASLPDHATQVDVGAATAWEQGRIVFDQEPLSQVVEQFNRYGRLPITVLTPEIGERRVSGSFQATDSDSFVAYLRTMKGVRVETSAQGVRISRR